MKKFYGNNFVKRILYFEIIMLEKFCEIGVLILLRKVEMSVY
jgi:hypothetical protein